jgi:hypothetical protein
MLGRSISDMQYSVFCQGLPYHKFPSLKTIVKYYAQERMYVLKTDTAFDRSGASFPISEFDKRTQFKHVVRWSFSTLQGYYY